MCNEIIQFVDAKEQVRLPNLSTCALNVRGVDYFPASILFIQKSSILKLLLLLIIVLIIIKLKVSFR